MLEEDNGIVEIYKELVSPAPLQSYYHVLHCSFAKLLSRGLQEREMRGKKYSANLEHIDFSTLDLLRPEVLSHCYTSTLSHFH